eukprot:CAMPEP_0172481290 /NCGR_PEP_ID=MMETSP1066-20121228/7035_1 /TAXON_ID=671091 /ORGANISM="Coscinodiscus wailesii, Strain CCMP2513" /LENGTH=512 /DNA_ID=CAMNT_0013243423 /DNA_START=306 /DNA_END=1843 /DNA_ORIENTATION=+
MVLPEGQVSDYATEVVRDFLKIKGYDKILNAFDAYQLQPGVQNKHDDDNDAASLIANATRGIRTLPSLPRTISMEGNSDQQANESVLEILVKQHAITFAQQITQNTTPITACPQTQHDKQIPQPKRKLDPLSTSTTTNPTSSPIKTTSANQKQQSKATTNSNHRASSPSHRPKKHSPLRSTSPTRQTRPMTEGNASLRHNQHHASRHSSHTTETTTTTTSTLSSTTPHPTATNPSNITITTTITNAPKPPPPATLAHIRRHLHHALKTSQITPLPKTRSKESWIPEVVRTRIIRRDLSVAKLNSQSEALRRRASATLRRGGPDGKRREIRIDDDVLERSRSKEKYGLETKKPCALCHVPFLPVNLIMAVPLKAILDIRDSWGDAFDPEGVREIKVNPNLRRAPACYNERKVCAFCAQLFDQQQDTYRPSWEAKEAERVRLKEIEEEKERKVLDDPLTQMTKEEEMEIQMLMSCGVGTALEGELLDDDGKRKGRSASKIYRRGSLIDPRRGSI